jgi:hypothetical protein
VSIMGEEVKIYKLFHVQQAGLHIVCGRSFAESQSRCMRNRKSPGVHEVRIGFPSCAYSVERIQRLGSRGDG